MNDLVYVCELVCELEERQEEDTRQERDDPGKSKNPGPRLTCVELRSQCIKYHPLTLCKGFRAHHPRMVHE